MNNNTFILLSRSILDSEVFASQKMLKIWIWCLCKANYKSVNVPLKVGKGVRVVKVDRGQFLFGRFKAEEELFIDGSTIYKIIKKLEQIGNISIKSNNQYSIITILNYDYYQTQNNYQVASNEQPSNNQVTTNEQPSNNQVTHTKKDKKDKKDKKGKEEIKKGLIFPFDSDRFKEYWNLWKQYKKEQHKFTYKSQLSEQAALKKLSSLSDTDEATALLIIENSIAQGYKGFFKLKNSSYDQKKGIIASISSRIRQENPEL